MNYNAWTENTLYLDTYLYDDVALVEWQYYNWNTGQFEEIPYMSQPILGSNGQIIGYSNNAKRENYYIRLSESADFIDHTKPFVIRPMYQKKVKLTLGKKAYYNYLGDDSTIGNSAQTPQIHNSPDQDMTAGIQLLLKVLDNPQSGHRVQVHRVVLKRFHLGFGQRADAYQCAGRRKHGGMGSAFEV